LEGHTDRDVQYIPSTHCSQSLPVLATSTEASGISTPPSPATATSEVTRGDASSIATKQSCPERHHIVSSSSCTSIFAISANTYQRSSLPEFGSEGIARRVSIVARMPLPSLQPNDPPASLSPPAGLHEHGLVRLPHVIPPRGDRAANERQQGLTNSTSVNSSIWGYVLPSLTTPLNTPARYLRSAASTVERERGKTVQVGAG
jgi:hypothetical protein